MLRFFLILIASYLVVKIVRGIFISLFPPIDPSDRSTSSTHQNEPPEKTAEYKDVKDAKFKDL